MKQITFEECQAILVAMDPDIGLDAGARPSAEWAAHIAELIAKNACQDGAIALQNQSDAVLVCFGNDLEQVEALVAMMSPAKKARAIANKRCFWVQTSAG